MTVAGSTLEVARLLGGSAVGDIRSRLLRLAPAGHYEGSKATAIRRLLGHQLVSLQSLDKQKFDGDKANH
jgi:hypothetical protein